MIDTIWIIVFILIGVGSTRVVKVKVLNCGLVVSEFQLQLLRSPSDK